MTTPTDVNTPSAQDVLDVAHLKLTEITDIIQVAPAVRQFVMKTEGEFSTTYVYTELGLRGNPIRQKAAHTALLRMKNEGLIEAIGKNAGRYRRILVNAPIMEWWSASREEYEIEYPLGVHELHSTYGGEMIIIAGDKNSAKSSYMMWLAYLNRGRHKVNYFHSELSENQLRVRIDKFNEYVGTTDEEWMKVNFRSRVMNFAQVIEPDELNLCDYLHRTDEFFLMGADVEEIYKKMHARKGVCIVAIQKKEYNEWGLGGEITIARPNLYMTIFKGKYSDDIRLRESPKLKIKISKSPRCGSPEGMKRAFEIMGEGSQLSPCGEWEYDKEKKVSYGG
uniref:Uncharacterized protein n=1 Tax=viral metagenome TaxID=1070528 RepID=A0A6H1ZI55_9ZZZZ